jgi:hypothetical protein
MSRPLALLDEIEVASPCSAAWEAMPGDQRVRFCADCQRAVHDLSAHTRVEAESLLSAAEGRLCVRFERRGDGLILTRDCVQDVRRAPRRWLGIGLALGLLLASAVFWLSASLDGRGAKFLREVEPFRTVMEWVDPSPPTFRKVCIGSISSS